MQLRKPDPTNKHNYASLTPQPPSANVFGSAWIPAFAGMTKKDAGMTSERLLSIEVVMQARGEEIARLQSDFYRDKFRKTLRWLIIAVIIMFLFIAAIIYTILFRKEPKYYANTTDGIILSMPKPETL